VAPPLLLDFLLEPQAAIATTAPTTRSTKAPLLKALIGFLLFLVARAPSGPIARSLVVRPEGSKRAGGPLTKPKRALNAAGVF
jgi:hypothetical protein